MKIAVLVKQVPGTESPLPIQSNQNWVDEGAVAYVMNESDNYALEEALQIREANDEGEVVAVSLGPDRSQKVIREALAKGADRGIHIQLDTAGMIDSLVTASYFADTFKDENFDLIFTGLQSDDLGMGQTGIILGELLGMSTASMAMATEVGGGKIKVKESSRQDGFNGCLYHSQPV
jgi:electron transfer flavoprotein beta subunit